MHVAAGPPPVLVTVGKRKALDLVTQVIKADYSFDVSVAATNLFKRLEVCPDGSTWTVHEAFVSNPAAFVAYMGPLTGEEVPCSAGLYFHACRLHTISILALHGSHHLWLGVHRLKFLHDACFPYCSLQCSIILQPHLMAGVHLQQVIANTLVYQQPLP
jgi:hypothetical protein